MGDYVEYYKINNKSFCVNSGKLVDNYGRES